MSGERVAGDSGQSHPADRGTAHDHAVDRLLTGFEHVVVRTLQLFLVLVVSLATVVLFVLLVSGLRERLAEIHSVAPFQETLRNAFAGVLAVVIGLELLETLRVYAASHRVRVEVILVVALIAVARHLLEIDLAHVGGPALLGIAGLTLALAASCFLVGRMESDPRERVSPTGPLTSGRDSAERPLQPEGDAP